MYIARPSRWRPWLCRGAQLPQVTAATTVYQVGCSHSHDDLGHPGAHNASNDGVASPVTSWSTTRLLLGVSRRACAGCGAFGRWAGGRLLPAGRLELRVAFGLLEDPSPRQAIFKSHSQDMFCCFLGFPLTVMTHMGKTYCCGSHPLGPTVDRRVSVNSGVRYS